MSSKGFYHTVSSQGFYHTMSAQDILSHNVFKRFLSHSVFTRFLSHNVFTRFLSHNVFTRYFITQCLQKVFSFGSLALSQTSPGFYMLKNKYFENSVGKGEIACKEQFLLFPQCFLPVWRAFCHFQQIRNCHLQTLSVWKSLKFVVWERLKT